jgi:hypothetical protein
MSSMSAGSRVIRNGRCCAAAAGLVASAAAALACAVALPADAQAATVAWSTKQPRTVNCSTPRSVSTGKGQANIKDCLVVSRSASGTYYYQGVLEVDYHRGGDYPEDVLGAKSMIARSGTPHALGVNDCPRQRWIDGQKRWCYSPTTSLPYGQVVYGKGVLLDSAGRWFPPAWSALLRTAPHSDAGSVRGGPISRQEVLARSLPWIQRRVMYSQKRFTGLWSANVPTLDRYRQDCSGYVSLVWHLATSPGSSQLRSPRFTTKIPISALRPGDALGRPGHIALFVGWAGGGRALVREEYLPGQPARQRAWTASRIAHNDAYRYHRIR